MEENLYQTFPLDTLSCHLAPRESEVLTKAPATGGATVDAAAVTPSPLDLSLVEPLLDPPPPVGEGRKAAD